MKTLSHARTHRGAAATATGVRRILVWDAPLRVFHWLMALSFAGAWLTAERDGWEVVHVTLGYTMAGLLVFRLVWGVAGTRYARFSDFVRGPAAVARYLGGLLRGRPAHYTGHNPAGALAVVALLVLTAVVAASGWAAWHDIGGELVEDLHEGAASVMLGVVVMHIAGVLVSSRLHRENLVAAMFSGRKQGKPEDAARRPWRGLAAVLLAAVLAFWWFQWQAAPVGAPADRHAGTEQAAGHDDD